MLCLAGSVTVSGNGVYVAGVQDNSKSSYTQGENENILHKPFNGENFNVPFSYLYLPDSFIFVNSLTIQL